MSDKDTFEEEVRPLGSVSAIEDGNDAPVVQLILDLEGYEGPLDALLGMARDQKVDLVHISILALANQYLDFVERAHHMHLEIAADYLVMAAWLAYLKSRLLLPQAEEDDEPSGPELAAALKFHLRRYEAMRGAGA
ncbi:MAG: segregation/condensation protein A, partial [Rhodospirillaceae bacterium]|nr:segregation/condensation protein A [Rhodospirillaceae bacterium]